MIDLINKYVFLYAQHTIIFWIIAIEIFPFIFMIKKVLGLIAERIVDSCVDNKPRENTVASVLYFFKDLGPNTASFSIVTLIVDMGKDDGLQSSTVGVLTIVFFVGILLKEKSRKFINIFYETLKIKRSIRWEQSLEH